MDHDNNDTGPAGLAGGPDAFAACFTLAAIAADPKGFARRLAQLQEATQASEEAQRKLAADREIFAADMEREKAAAKAEIEGAAAENKRVFAWLDGQRRELERKQGDVAKIYEALGVRDIPHTIGVDGSASMTRTNPDYISPLDQALMAMGKPPRPPEPDPLGLAIAATPNPEDPKTFQRPQWWRGEMIEPKAPKPAKVVRDHRSGR
jgi:hypothetical protein